MPCFRSLVALILPISGKRIISVNSQDTPYIILAFKDLKYSLRSHFPDILSNAIKTSVNLEYFEPKYNPYPQIGNGFLDNCAIIDLLFNCGDDAGKYIWGE